MPSDTWPLLAQAPNSLCQRGYPEGYLPRGAKEDEVAIFCTGFGQQHGKGWQGGLALQLRCGMYLSPAALIPQRLAAGVLFWRGQVLQAFKIRWWPQSIELYDHSGAWMHCFCLCWSDFKLVNNFATRHSCKIKCLSAWCAPRHFILHEWWVAR